MKRKAIHAELRKESEYFEGWFKYEITIQNEDFSIEKIPAYGKDLQDALNRVVHDEKVEKIKKKTEKIPDIVWLLLWFGYVLGWTILTYEVSLNDNFKAVFFIMGISLITSLIFLVMKWFSRKNIEK